MEHLLNRLPEKWEDKIIPLMTMYNKFVLGGSLALYILKMMDYDFEKRNPDLDFSLTEPFEEKEFLTLLDFFNLSIIKNSGDYEDKDGIIKLNSPVESLKKDLIMLSYYNQNQVFMDDHDLQEYQEKYYKVDFFNKNYLKIKDWFELDYFGTTIKITHPSIILAAKMMYGTDTRVGKQYKHFQDIQGIDWDNYFKIIKHIQPVINPIKDETDKNKEYVLDKYVFKDMDSELPF